MKNHHRLPYPRDLSVKRSSRSRKLVIVIERNKILSLEAIWGGPFKIRIYTSRSLTHLRIKCLIRYIIVVFSLYQYYFSFYLSYTKRRRTTEGWRKLSTRSCSGAEDYIESRETITRGVTHNVIVIFDFIRRFYLSLSMFVLRGPTKLSASVDKQSNIKGTDAQTSCTKFQSSLKKESIL